MEIKYIYWFAYFNMDEPSVRYRAKYPLDMLKAKYNIDSTIVYPGYDLKSIRVFLLAFISALFFRKANSIIVFQKIYNSGIYSTALKILLCLRPRQTIYDIDDAEYTRYPDSTIRYFMKKAEMCTAGSDSLSDYISELNKNVFLLTSPVIDHGITRDTGSKTLTVGWIGYYGAHRENLTQLFFPAVRKIDFPITIKILGVKTIREEEEIKEYFSGQSNVSIDAPHGLNWHNEGSIYESIRTFDIAVSPLIDNEFNRAKSAFKLKQCLSCGVPVLASSVGENKRFLMDGSNGYLCDSPDAYYEKIVSIRDSPVYPHLSRNAKASFATFSVDYYCETLLANLKKFQN
jgi:glycosyltransferase involved in cell wall biosynthesis